MPDQPEPSDPMQCSGEEGFCPEHGFHRHSLKQPPSSLRDLALAAAKKAVVRYWVPTDARELLVDAVLGVASRPVEHCGNQLPPLLGDGPVTECVLRPGHQGSHANDDGETAEATARTVLDTPAGQPALDRILADAEHHEACARLSKTPEGAISHSSIAAGLRIAIEHVKAGHDAEVAQLRQRLELAATDRRASRESERILQQQIDAQATEIDRLRAEADRWRRGHETAEAQLVHERRAIERVREAIAKRRAEVADYEAERPPSAWSDAVTVTCDRIDDALRTFPAPHGIRVDGEGQPKERP